MTDKEQLWSSIQSQLSQGGFGTADMIEACVRITDTIHEWFEEYHKERLLLLDVSGSVCGYYEARNTTDLKCRYCGSDKHEHEQTVR